MFSFTGTAGPQRRVDLRGKSRAEETREETLEKARLQREKRQRAKLEQKSALVIQSRWRQTCTARHYAAILREQWIQAYGSALTDGTRHLLEGEINNDSRCMSMLLRFYDPSQEADRRKLAWLCTAVSSTATKGTCTLLSQAASAAHDKLQGASTGTSPATGAASPSTQQLALYRISKLTELCLTTLVKHNGSLSAVLSSQYSALTSLQEPAAALIDFLIKIINPDTWKASLAHQQLPAQAAAAGAGAVLTHLYHKQLYINLRFILQAIPAGVTGKTCGDVLVTQLAVRSITLQLARKQNGSQPGAVSTAADVLQQGVCQLLFVPGLWARCASLVPVTGRLCTIALAELCQVSSSSQLLATLQSAAGGSTATRLQQHQQMGATDTAAADSLAVAAAGLAAFVDNLTDAASAGTLLKGTDSERVLAGQIVSALALAIEAEQQLTVLQKQLARQQQQRKRPQSGAQHQQRSKGGTATAAFVPGAGFIGQHTAGLMAVDSAAKEKAQVSEEPESMDVDSVASATAASTTAEASNTAGAGPSTQAVTAAAGASGTTLQQPVAASVYSAEQAAQQQQGSNTNCFHLLAGTSKGTQLLRKLVALVLPATTAAESQQLQQQQQLTTSAPPQGIRPGGLEQQQLCSLLWKLSRPMQYRQRIWLGLSVGVRLVPRLWFSYILPLHLSTPGGLLNLSTAGNSAAAGTVLAAAVSSSAGGWVQPMLVLVQAFSAALSFTHLEDFYAEAASLVPLQQLYDSSNPSAGLVMLLRNAVWQILWNEAGANTQQQQQQLKRSLGEVGGLLLCQLHDRNCTRQYCPAEAFLADIPAGRVLQEVTARGGAGGALGLDSDDEDSEGFNALEQQQQWQRQRQQGLGTVEGTAAAAEQQQDDGSPEGLAHPPVPAAAARGVFIGPGDAVQTTGGFGFGSNDPVQQRRQQAAAAGAAAGSGASNPPAAGIGSRVWLVLQHAPCLIPFQDRVQLFQSVVSAEKEAAAAAAESSPFMFDDPMDFLMGAHGNKRDQLLDDSYSQLKLMNSDRLKGRLRIAYVNEAGLAEAGIDGGGLFKDFMEELLKQGFSPQAKLFADNPNHQLYPSPFARQLVPDAEGQLQFLGRMLGKSLYEGILLELPLAAFFLKKMRGGVCDINDLPSLDPEVYKNLLQLRHYKGDFSELSLNFTATVVEPSQDSAAGSSSSSSPHPPRQREVELKPGGRDIPVTAHNVTEYIHRLADFRLNRQMDWAASAFLRGFFELIKPRWVRMFNESELQMLISGSEEGINVDDLSQHVNYAGGYHEEHPVIETFWKALRSFNPQQQRQFLKFVTSCSRAPLLGFAYLEPQLCIQMSGSVLTPTSRERLPTAATCMNLLKLPPYVGFEEMRSKLLYAVTAGAGFELS